MHQTAEFVAYQMNVQLDCFIFMIPTLFPVNMVALIVTVGQTQEQSKH